MFGLTRCSLLCIMVLFLQWNFPLLGATQQSEGAVLTNRRREIGVVGSNLSVRAITDVAVLDRKMAASHTDRPGSLWPLIGLAVSCWALVATMVRSFV